MMEDTRCCDDEIGFVLGTVVDLDSPAAFSKNATLDLFAVLDARVHTEALSGFFEIALDFLARGEALGPLGIQGK